MELFTPTIVIAFTLVLSYIINEKQKRSILRFLPAPLLLLNFFFAENTVSFAVLLLPSIYAVIVMAKKGFYPEKFTSRRKIIFCTKLSFLPLLLSVAAGYNYLVQTGYFNYFFAHLIFAICFMRVTNCDERTIADPKFIALNLAAVCFGVGAIIFITSPQSLFVIFGAIWLIYLNFLLPIIMFLLTAVAAAIYHIFTIPTFEPAQRGQEPAQLGMAEYGFEQHTAATNPMLFNIIIIITVIVISVFILRKILKRLLAASNSNSDFEILPYESESGSYFTKKSGFRSGYGLFAPKDPRLAVRYYYRRFLKLCSKKGIPHKKNDTSKDVIQKNGQYFSAQVMNDLREVYITARYSNHEITKNDSKKIEALVKKI
ncbi:MAG: hypothetical protein FWG63_10210 [Defluviitaleaceae bacterium]|nr:hypothetical protein [Defluviitaleaceae bacterium]